MAEKYLGRDFRQIHIYTNMYYADDRFGLLFNKLFKPAPILQSWIDENLQILGQNFIALSFRFQNLLGDSVDGKIVYSPEEQRELINSCICQIELLRKTNPEFEKDSRYCR